MNSEQPDISATILIEVPNTTMHRFIEKESNIFTSGTCKIAKIENPNKTVVFFINLNSFYYTLNKSVIFVKIEYDDTVSYLFPHFDTGLSAITLLKNSPSLHNFQQILENASQFYTWSQAQTVTEIKEKLEQHCSANIDKEPIVIADNIKKYIKATGKFLGEAFKTIGNYVSEGVKYTGNYLDGKIQQPTEKTDVNLQTKQKWERLKNGTTTVINVSVDVFNKYLMPVINKGLQIGQEVTKKMEQSGNPKIKYVGQLAETSKQAVTQAFAGLVEGTTKVGGQLGESTRKLVNKKYGEDYVKTFIPDQKKEQQTPGILKQQSESEQLYPKIGQVEELDQKHTPKQ